MLTWQISIHGTTRHVASGATENFNPKQPVTRAQAATILNRMLNGAGLAHQSILLRS
ncbi:MAG: S-layer homology domain-containing protein [Veillonella sp.]